MRRAGAAGDLARLVARRARPRRAPAATRRRGSTSTPREAVRAPPAVSGDCGCVRKSSSRTARQCSPRFAQGRAPRAPRVQLEDAALPVEQLELVHGPAFSFLRGERAVSAMRFARVSGRFASISQRRIVRFAASVNASKLRAAAGLAASAASRSSGSSSASAESYRLHEPSAFAASTTRAARLGQHAALLEPGDALLVRARPRAARLARRDELHQALVVDRLLAAVDPAEAERLLDERVVVERAACRPASRSRARRPARSRGSRSSQRRQASRSSSSTSS